MILAKPYGHDFDLYLRVGNITGECSDYALDTSFVLDPCIGVPDDILEDNDDCQSAVPIVPGSYNDLVITNDDPDYYRFAVQPGERVVVTETADSYEAYYELRSSDCSTIAASESDRFGLHERWQRFARPGPEGVFRLPEHSELQYL